MLVFLLFQALGVGHIPTFWLLLYMLCEPNGRPLHVAELDPKNDMPIRQSNMQLEYR